MLVAPLDWGLGHATRCIPIIRALQKMGHEVLIAAEGSQAVLLINEFPNLKVLPLKGYRITYSRRKWWLPFALLLQLPRLLRIIQYERAWLNRIIDKHHIDLVISDNRYGLHSKKVACIFITHQLTIKIPVGWIERMVQRINYHYIRQFNSCWVPDVAGSVNLAGILSHPRKLPRTPVHYIGLLSRFMPKEATKKYDYCIVLSGPEPQRTLLENTLLTGLMNVEGEILLVRGMPGQETVLKTAKHIEVRNHLTGKDLQEAIMQSEFIISRSGYTTVMELISLQKKSILIPTPGQTEQEYLAKKLQQDHICLCIEQKEFNCAKHFTMAKTFAYRFPHLLLFDEDTIDQLLKASLDHRP